MNSRVMLLAWVAVALAAAAQATSLSYTGSLANGQAGDTCSDVYAASCFYTLTFTLGSQSNVTIQTWGFGGTNGGSNAAGNPISPGGFDELIALWSGTGAGATLIDGSADVLLNFPSYSGCPPAATVHFVNGDDVCGDLTMQFNGLAAGDYTITLSDANYQPNALTCCGSMIGDGFADLTGAVFQTCDFNGNGQACLTPGANWAFDLTTSESQPIVVPEPGSLALVAYGCGAVVMARRIRPKRSERGEAR